MLVIECLPKLSSILHTFGVPGRHSKTICAIVLLSDAKIFIFQRFSICSLNPIYEIFLCKLVRIIICFDKKWQLIAQANENIMPCVRGNYTNIFELGLFCKIFEVNCLIFSR